jgi:hypothetical protein
MGNHRHDEDVQILSHDQRDEHLFPAVKKLSSHKKNVGGGIPSASQKLGGTHHLYLTHLAQFITQCIPRTTTNSKMCKPLVAAKAMIS